LPLRFRDVGTPLRGLGNFDDDLLGEIDRSFLAQQARSKLANYRLCNVILDREDIVHFSVIGIGPELESIRDVDELNRDPHPTRRHPDTSLDYRYHMQSLSDLGDGCRLSLE
jgi:hypothetical protein